MDSNATEKETHSPQVAKKLGRGIASLLTIDDDFNIDFNNDTHYRTASVIDTFGLKELDVNSIIPNPDQPRKYFDDKKLYELSESIKHSGLLQPIIVSPSNKDQNNNINKYIIIAGERRYRASKIAGLSTIKAIVLDVPKQNMLKHAMLENVQRENLNPIEEASGYKKIIDTFGYTHEQLAKEIGKSRAHITNLLRILTLPDEIQSAIRNGNITLGHAKVLLGADSPTKYLSTIIEKQLSVRQLERLIVDNDGEAENTTIDHTQESNNKHKNDDTANITFEMIKQLYGPISQNEEDDLAHDDKKLDVNKVKNKLNKLTDEEWQKAEKNIKIIEQQLSESCGFKVNLRLKPEGSGKLEIEFNNAEDLLELVKMF